MGAHAPNLHRNALFSPNLRDSTVLIDLEKINQIPSIHRSETQHHNGEEAKMWHFQNASIAILKLQNKQQGPPVTCHRWSCFRRSCKGCVPALGGSRAHGAVTSVQID